MTDAAEDKVAAGGEPPRGLLLTVAGALGFLLRWSAYAVRLLLAQMLITVFVALLWLSLSTTAPAWLWAQLGSQLPQLQLEGISGRFATGLDIAGLSWRDEARELRLSRVHLRWQAADLLQGRISLSQVSAAEGSLRVLKDTPPEPLSLPEIDLPFAWALSGLQVGRFEWRPWQGDPVQLDDLRLSGEGAGSRITLADLSLRHALGRLSAAGRIETTAFWPMDLNLLVKAAGDAWPEQRVSVGGDISALKLRARGPRAWPLDLAVTADVRPVQPAFQGYLNWPRWQPQGQKDWRLEAGGLAFRGTAGAGEARLSLRAVPLQGGDLPWPPGWPRLAELSGPLSWRTDAGRGSASARVDWQGRFGSMPWLLKGGVDSARLAQTRLDMQLADARLALSGWPDARGLRADLQLPRLQRFQSQLAGALAVQARWQGLSVDGRGHLDIRASQWRQGKTDLFDELKVAADGSLARQSWQIDGRRADIGASLGLQGGADLKRRLWQGSLQRGSVRTGAGDWLLQAPASLSLSVDRQQLAEQCWRQAGWRVCGQADLLPVLWSARLRAEAGEDGSLQASLRRDPRQADPALDADLALSGVNLARLPVSLPPGLALAGRADARAHLSGSLDAPWLTGDFTLADASLDMPAYGLAWRPLTLSGRLLGDRAEWRGRITDASGGSAELTGNARLRPALRVEARLNGQALQLAYAPWATAKASPDIGFVYADGRAQLQGRIVVPSAVITLRQPDASVLVTSPDARIVRDRDGRAPKAAGDGGAGLPLDMTLAVVLGDNIKLTGMGLTAKLLGQLTLMQHAGESLSANGELRLSDDAVYEAYGQRLQIRSGRFLFAGPPTRPDISIEAVRTVDDITVGVRLSGRAQAPQAELFSDEPLAQEEILSMLVLGRSLNDTSAPTAAERQAMALGAALKLGGRTGALDKLGQRLGIQDFALGTEGESEQTQVAVSGYIRPDLYLSFGMGVFEPTQTVKVRYQMNKRLSLEAMTSLESAITLFYSWRF